MYSQATGELVKLILALFAALIVLFQFLAWRRQGQEPDDRTNRRLRRLLLLLVIVAGGNYYRFNPALFLQKVNAYDMFHYYMGSKYFAELDYYYIYPAVLLADSEDQRFFQKIGIRHYRDHRSQKVVPADRMFADAVEIRQRFTTQQWESFKHDIRHFIRITPTHEWSILFDDRGYNATPVARWLGAVLSSRIPVESLKLVGFVDLGLLTIALVLVGRSCGASTVLWSLAFLFISFSGRWPLFGHAMLRMDWISAMMVAVVLLRSRRETLAGVFWGYAVCIRVFPVVFLIGPGIRLIRDLLKRPRLAGPAAKFIGAALLTFAALNEIVLIQDGTAPFGASLRKLLVHQKSENLSSQRVGFGVALAYRGELFKEDSHSGRRWTQKKKLVGEFKPVRYAVAAAVLYLLARLVLRRPPEDAVTLGMAAFFFLSIASYYYYIMRVLLVIMHASDLRRRSNSIGLLLLFVIEMISQLHQLIPTSRYAATAQLSILLAVYFVTVFIVNLVELYGARRHDIAQSC